MILQLKSIIVNQLFLLCIVKIRFIIPIIKLTRQLDPHTININFKIIVNDFVT